jgi:hypothetical protein
MAAKITNNTEAYFEAKENNTTFEADLDGKGDLGLGTCTSSTGRYGDDITVCADITLSREQAHEFHAWLTERLYG